MKNLSSDMENVINDLIEGLIKDVDILKVDDEKLERLVKSRQDSFIAIKDLLGTWQNSPNAPREDKLIKYVEKLIKAGNKSAELLREAFTKKIDFDSLDPEKYGAATKAKVVVYRAVSEIDSGVRKLRQQIDNKVLNFKEQEFKPGFPERFANQEFYPEKNYNKKSLDKENDAIIICPKGTKGEMIVLDGLKIWLPEPPKNKKDILFSKLPKEEQYWRRQDVPLGLTPDNENEYEEYILEEFRRRREGVWFMNNGKPTWVTPAHYMGLQWNEMLETGGYKKFRLAQCNLYYFALATMLDDRCVGMIFCKGRRSGFTEMALDNFVNSSTSIKNRKFGITSKTEDDAEVAFLKYSHTIQNLPFFFRPVVQGKIDDKSKMLFGKPSDNTKSAKQKNDTSTKDYLNVLVDYRATSTLAYDSIAMYMYLGDECFGKGTKILMSDFAFKNIEDIKIGDFVKIEGGKDVEVLNTVYGQDELYKIKQPYAKDYIVNSKHKLYFKRGKTTTLITPQEYLSLSQKQQLKFKRIYSKTFRKSRQQLNVSVEKHGFGEYYGITLDSGGNDENRRLILEDYTVALNCGKWVRPNNYIDHWTNVKPTLIQGGEIVGKALLGSTLNPLDKGGSEFQTLFYGSSVKNRNSNGETPTGLYSFFLPAHKNYERFTDIYGVCHETVAPGDSFINERGKEQTEGALQYLEAKFKSAKSMGGKAYNNTRRLDPITIEDAFRDELASQLLDIEKINSQLNYNKNVEVERRLVRGNFRWKNGIKDGEVEWIPEEKGRFLVSWIPDKEMRNRFVSRPVFGITTKCPVNDEIGAFGCDPYDQTSVVDAKLVSTENGTEYNLGSKGSMHGLTGFNLGDLPNNQFFLEYIARPKDADTFFEDILMACIFYSMPVLVENNKKMLLKHFKVRGYRGFCLSRFDKESNRLSVDEKELGGIPNNSADIINMHWTGIEKYVNNYVGEYTCDEGDTPVREVGQMGTMPFNRTLADWLKFNIENRTKFDASISSGLAIMAVNRHAFKPKVEKKVYTLKMKTFKRN